MRLLLDTHTFLWFVSDSPRLSRSARDLLVDTTNRLALSVGSLWEMAIKISLGKLTLSAPFQEWIQRQMAWNDVASLAISPEHLDTVSRLPFHHRDPFDRLLVAQALCDGLPIVGADPAMDAYGVDRLW